MSTAPHMRHLKKRALGLFCLAITTGLLAVGLWPFNFWPRNKVFWLRGRDGIQMGWQGVVYSNTPLPICSFRADGFRPARLTVAILIESNQGPRYYAGILSFYHARERNTFALGQKRSELVLQGHFRTGTSQFRPAQLQVPDVLHDGQVQLLTITWGFHNISVYLDGKLQHVFPRIAENARDFCGRLVLGHSIAGYHPWAGKMYGVAVYNDALSRQQVLTHYSIWQDGKIANSKDKKTLAALYLFKKGAGHTIRDFSANHSDLVIPLRFRRLRISLLERSNLLTELRGGNFEDIVINVLGFVPLGFLLFAYLRRKQNGAWTAAAASILVGLSISLVIEVLQAYLPSRNSSMNDLITNSLGTALGVVLCLIVLRFFPRGRLTELFRYD